MEMGRLASLLELMFLVFRSFLLFFSFSFSNLEDLFERI